MFVNVINFSGIATRANLIPKPLLTNRRSGHIVQQRQISFSEFGHRLDIAANDIGRKCKNLITGANEQFSGIREILQKRCDKKDNNNTSTFRDSMYHSKLIEKSLESDKIKLDLDFEAKYIKLKFLEQENAMLQPIIKRRAFILKTTFYGFCGLCTFMMVKSGRFTDHDFHFIVISIGTMIFNGLRVIIPIDMSDTNQQIIERHFNEIAGGIRLAKSNTGINEKEKKHEHIL